MSARTLVLNAGLAVAYLFIYLGWSALVGWLAPTIPPGDWHDFFVNAIRLGAGVVAFNVGLACTAIYLTVLRD